jgi:CDP-diglyceride synthetase
MNRKTDYKYTPLCSLFSHFYSIESNLKDSTNQSEIRFSIFNIQPNMSLLSDLINLDLSDSTEKIIAEYIWLVTFFLSFFSHAKKQTRSTHSFCLCFFFVVVVVVAASVRTKEKHYYYSLTCSVSVSAFALIFINCNVFLNHMIFLVLCLSCCLCDL